LRVIFSDCDRTATEFAGRNARLNGFSNFELLAMDWRHPPDAHYPLIIGSDLAFERRHVDAGPVLLTKILAPDGLRLLTDQDRPHAKYLQEELKWAGMEFTTEVMRAGEPGGDRYKGTLYRIRRAKPDS